MPVVVITAVPVQPIRTWTGLRSRPKRDQEKQERYEGEAPHLLPTVCNFSLISLEDRRQLATTPEVGVGEHGE